MRIYRVIWNHEPERYYLAESVTEAMEKDIEAVRREWDEGENAIWNEAEEYQSQFSSIELVGELEP